MLALVVGYFFLPFAVREWIPVWLPFLLALGLEVEFFWGAYRSDRAARRAPDRGPQGRDLADLGWYYELPGVRAPGFRWRHVVEAAAAIAIVAVILWSASRPHGWDAVPPEQQARAEAVFSREAARIAGHETDVVCDTSGGFVGVVQDADGLAEVGGSRAYLTPAICDTLYQLEAKGRVQSSSKTARAIAVLAHEAWHLAGVRDEGVTNCRAFRSGVQLGVNLGLSERTARRMMREQFAQNATSPPEYRVPADCSPP